MSTPTIELVDVERTYGGAAPVRALRPCNLSVQPGDFVAIEGPSGSGKSTLLNILGLLDRPSAGTYLFDGVDVASLRERDRSALRGQRIGFVFQTFELLPHRPAVESVKLSLMYRGLGEQEQRSRAVAALVRVGLGHRTEARSVTLSGGEKQRVAIARALAGEPSIVLCDEPTGNLDSENASIVLDRLKALNATGVTIALITHNPEVAAVGSRRLVIRDGLMTETS
jgi:putative ABC transport system ATP-binding protein